MAAQNESALLLEYGNLWIGADAGSVVDFGAVRNVQGVLAPIKTEIRSDNRGVILDRVRMEGSVTFDWLEPGDVARLENLLKGIVTLSTVAGSQVAGATQLVAQGSWADRVFIPFENQQGAGTTPTAVSVVGSSDSTLEVNSDYAIVKDAQGIWGIVPNISGEGGTALTTASQNLTITYTYTPNASITITGGTSKTATPRYVKIIGPSAADANKRRIFILEEAVIDAEATLPFIDTEEAGDVGVVPVTLKNRKNAEWSYTDEINV